MGERSARGTPQNVIEWKYEKEEWRDLLTLWNGQPLEYDTIGNPTSYGYLRTTRREFEWIGRQLQSMSVCHMSYTTNIAYGYNAQGQRIRQSITGESGETVTTQYFYNGEILAGQISDDGKTLVFYYDNNGQIFGFRYNNTTI